MVVIHCAPHSLIAQAVKIATFAQIRIAQVELITRQIRRPWLKARRKHLHRRGLSLHRLRRHLPPACAQGTASSHRRTYALRVHLHLRLRLLHRGDLAQRRRRCNPRLAYPERTSTIFDVQPRWRCSPRLAHPMRARKLTNLLHPLYLFLKCDEFGECEASV